MTETTNKPLNLKWHTLADDEIHKFDEEGYLIVRGVLDPPTISKLIEVGDRLMAAIDVKTAKSAIVNCTTVFGTVSQLMTSSSPC